MSAFVVSQEHIRLLLHAARFAVRATGGGSFTWWAAGARQQMDMADPTATGQMLLDACRSSVAYRYPQDGPDHLPGHGEPAAYVDRSPRNPSEISVVAMLKAIDCYEYQSCELPTWNGSLAERFCDRMRRDLITTLPGYDKARWDVLEVSA